jgi:hypothetical protein
MSKKILQKGGIDKNDPKHNRPLSRTEQIEYETNFKNLSLVNVPDSFEIDKVSFINSIVSELDNLKINVKETINYFKIYFIKLKKEVNDNENKNKLDIGFTISSSGKNDTLGENDICWTVENGILKRTNNHDEFKEFISWYEKSSIYKEIKTKVIIYEIKDLHNFLLKFFLLQDNKGLEYKMIKFNEIEYEKICLSSHAKDNTNNLSLGYDFGTIYP